VLMQGKHGLHGFAAVTSCVQNALLHTKPAFVTPIDNVTFGLFTAPNTTPDLTMGYLEHQQNREAWVIDFNPDTMDPGAFIALAAGFNNEPFRFQVVANHLSPLPEL
jgi:hypothetical protein